MCGLMLRSRWVVWVGGRGGGLVVGVGSLYGVYSLRLPLSNLCNWHRIMSMMNLSCLHRKEVCVKPAEARGWEYVGDLFYIYLHRYLIPFLFLLLLSLIILFCEVHPSPSNIPFLSPSFPNHPPFIKNPSVPSSYQSTRSLSLKPYTQIPIHNNNNTIRLTV